MEPLVLVPLPDTVAPVTAFSPIGGEAPVARVVRSVLGTVAQAGIAVVTTQALADEAGECLRSVAPGAAVVVVPGPLSRRQALAAGLESFVVERDSSRPVLVCDHRYPLSPGAVADRIVLALRAGHDVVVPTRPVTDTIKTVDEWGSVLGTVDRAALRTVQFPRGFAASVLWQMISTSSGDDVGELDAALRAGLDVATVDGDPDAFEVELPRDAHLLDALIACRPW